MSHSRGWGLCLNQTVILFLSTCLKRPNFLYTILDHFRKSESPSFDSLNERFYDFDNIPKFFQKIPMGTCEETSLKLDKLVQFFGKKP